MPCTGKKKINKKGNKVRTNFYQLLRSRCDPPSVPYLGIYLSDLTFIDEGTPNRTEKNLINFAKMRMVIKICIFSSPKLHSHLRSRTLSGR